MTPGVGGRDWPRPGVLRLKDTFFRFLKGKTGAPSLMVVGCWGSGQTVEVGREVDVTFPEMVSPSPK